MEPEKRCVILAAGPVSDYGPVKQLIGGGDFIICADGGTRHLPFLGVRPDVVMGDLDSSGETIPRGVNVIPFNVHKDETDTLLAVRHGLELGYKKFAIFGALGGRLDHTYANFCVLYHIAASGGTGVLYDADNEVHMLLGGEIRIKKRDNYYISVFPFGLESEGVTEKGMKYVLNDAHLTAGFPVGVSNEFKDSEAVISVKKGPLIIILSKR